MQAKKSVEILRALCNDIPNLSEDELRELRRDLFADRTWCTPKGGGVRWDEDPAWVDEIHAINERLKTF